MIVEIKPIPDFPGYYISNDGRVYSSKKNSGFFIPIKIRKTKRGYMQVGIYNKKARWMPVHRLVLKAFIGEPPAGFECAHLNGNPIDNNLENLKWVSKAENAYHKKIHGTEYRGSRVNTAKLTAEKVLEIRSKFKRTGPKISNTKELCEEFGVNFRTISSIVNRNIWKHI